MTSQTVTEIGKPEPAIFGNGAKARKGDFVLTTYRSPDGSVTEHRLRRVTHASRDGAVKKITEPCNYDAGISIDLEDMEYEHTEGEEYHIASIDGVSRTDMAERLAAATRGTTPMYLSFSSLDQAARSIRHMAKAGLNAEGAYMADYNIHAGAISDIQNGVSADEAAERARERMADLYDVPVEEIAVPGQLPIKTSILDTPVCATCNDKTAYVDSNGDCIACMPEVTELTQDDLVQCFECAEFVATVNQQRECSQCEHNRSITESGLIECPECMETVDALDADGRCAACISQAEMYNLDGDGTEQLLGDADMIDIEAMLSQPVIDTDTEPEATESADTAAAMVKNTCLLYTSPSPRD